MGDFFIYIFFMPNLDFAPLYWAHRGCRLKTGHGHRDLSTESAQWADSVKRRTVYFVFFYQHHITKWCTVQSCRMHYFGLKYFKVQFCRVHYSKVQYRCSSARFSTFGCLTLRCSPAGCITLRFSTACWNTLSCSTVGCSTSRCSHAGCSTVFMVHYSCVQYFNLQSCRV